MAQYGHSKCNSPGTHNAKEKMIFFQTTRKRQGIPPVKDTEDRKLYNTNNKVKHTNKSFTY